MFTAAFITSVNHYCLRTASQAIPVQYIADSENQSGFTYLDYASDRDSSRLKFAAGRTLKKGIEDFTTN